jgi:hypothetical protein
MERMYSGRHRGLGPRVGYAFALGLLAASGCSRSSVKGAIDGIPVDVKSAFYFADTDVLAEDDLVTVVLSDLKDACQDYGYYLESTKDMAGADDFASAWAAVFPPDFWEIALILRVGDSAVPLDGSQFVGIDWDETLDERSHGFASIVHNRALRDSAYFDGSGPASDYLDGYLSRGGRIEIAKHIPGSSLRGEFGTEIVDRDEGATKGLVQMKFDAAFCDVDIL